jgi:hypothetical protein
MNKVLIWVSVVLVVVFGGKALVNYMSRSANENAARTRVQAFLDGMKSGGDFQNGFNMWETGAAGAIQNMTQDQYNMEVAALQAWLDGRKVARPVGGYEILEATLVRPPQGVTPAAVVVSCSIDGQRLGILAVKDQRLEWSD